MVDWFAPAVAQAPAAMSASAPAAATVEWGGEKFETGFGPTQLFEMDYWELRAKSSQLFRENLYARGLVRRLVTNEINTGLTPIACPISEIVGVSEDTLADWSEDAESRFRLWGKRPGLCCGVGEHTFGALQRTARLESLVGGDVLVVMTQLAVEMIPTIRLVRGENIQNPLEQDTLAKGHTIEEGVELDRSRRQVAYWVQQLDGGCERIPAYGKRTGRRTAWLVYGSERRVDEVRGEPLLATVLQSLKEIDRYRDSAQRKAVVNSMVAMFIKRDADKMTTLPITGGAVKRGAGPEAEGPGRSFRQSRHLPGTVLEELQVGEEPVMLGGTGTDVNFGAFESAVIQAIAWTNEIPPEILTLAFSNNYSASQAAINEFKIYLNKIWNMFGAAFCQPIYEDWLLSESLNRKVSGNALLAAWRDRMRHDEYGAWLNAEWIGSVKPSTDMLKQVKASEMLVEGGYSTRAIEARIMSGTNFTQNVKRLRRENALIAAARAALEPDKETPTDGEK